MNYDDEDADVIEEYPSRETKPCLPLLLLLGAAAVAAVAAATVSPAALQRNPLLPFFPPLSRLVL